jgi:plasmid stabilization system protein ParE
MTGRVILRPQVPGDLEEIIDYLAARSPRAAVRFAQAVHETIGDLARMPGMGSPKRFRAKRLAGIRSWLVRGFPNHLILYRPVDVGIEVFAVVHGARRLGRILGTRV